MNPGITVLVTGDMGFLYDSNALWNRYITSRLKIIVMKNGGGGIFRFIQGPSELDELEECFETARQVNVRGFAERIILLSFRQKMNWSYRRYCLYSGGKANGRPYWL